MNWLTGGRFAQGEAKRLITQLTDSTKRDIAAKELIKLGADGVSPLIDALQTHDLSLLLYYQQILARISSATPMLTKTLATAHPIVRGRVAEIFGISKDRSAIPALLDALKGEYFTVRSRAALTLGNIGDASVIPFLLPLLKDKEDEVRSAACIAIAKFRDPSAFDDIANLLLDDLKIEVRQSAARALGETHHTAALPYLLEALHDSSWWYEREQAAGDLLAAIQKMGQPAVDPLIEALNDREGTVRKFAASLLGELGDARAIEPLGMTIYDLHHEVGEAAAESLARFGGASFEVLNEALAHPEAGIREHAVVALGKIQDARVTPALIEMLRDPEALIQKAAIHALAGQRDPRAVAALKEIAANRTDRVLSALAKDLLLKKSSS